MSIVEPERALQAHELRKISELLCKRIQSSRLALDENQLKADVQATMHSVAQLPEGARQVRALRAACSRVESASNTTPGRSETDSGAQTTTSSLVANLRPIHRAARSFFWLVSGPRECWANYCVVRCSQLFRTEFIGKLADRSREPERHLIVFAHGCACIASNIERFVQGHDERDCVGYGLASHFAAVNAEQAGAMAGKCAIG